jgi:hypothetical protein
MQLLNITARLPWLAVCCAVEEGACAVSTAPSTAAASCVAAALFDATRRLTLLGGRDNMPRSLASPLAGAVALFLGAGRRDAPRSLCHLDAWLEVSREAALSRDGSTLVVLEGGRVRVLRLADGATITLSTCTFILNARSVCVAPDDVVYVASLSAGVVQTTLQLRVTAVESFAAVDADALSANEHVLLVALARKFAIVVYDRASRAPVWSGESFGVDPRQRSVCCIPNQRDAFAVVCALRSGYYY